MNAASRILGIDPGTLYMGYALLDVERTSLTGAGSGKASIVDFGVCDVHKLEGQYPRLQREFFFLQDTTCHLPNLANTSYTS